MTSLFGYKLSEVSGGRFEMPFSLTETFCPPMVPYNRWDAGVTGVFTVDDATLRNPTEDLTFTCKNYEDMWVAQQEDGQWVTQGTVKCLDTDPPKWDKFTQLPCVCKFATVLLGWGIRIAQFPRLSLIHI